MPFEIAESQKVQTENPNYILKKISFNHNSHIKREEDRKDSMLFVDNHILFDGISRLESEVQTETETDFEMKESLVGMVDNLQVASIINNPANINPSNIRAQRYRNMKKSNSQLVFNPENDVLSRCDGIPSVAHQLR